MLKVLGWAPFMNGKLKRAVEMSGAFLEIDPSKHRALPTVRWAGA
jgi:hypothetical protein